MQKNYYGGFNITLEGTCCISCDTPLKINRLTKDEESENMLSILKAIALEDYNFLYPKYGYTYMLDYIFNKKNLFDFKVITFQDNSTFNMIKFRNILLNIDMRFNEYLSINEYHEFINLYLKSRICELEKEENELVENVVKGRVVINWN